MAVSGLILGLLLSPYYVAGALCGIFSLYVIGTVVYRLLFHPLAKYPGPFLAKLTDGYVAYHAWKGDRHLEYWRCHQKYGHFVRMGPNTVSIDTNTALKTIYGFKSNVRKSDFYSAFPVNKHAWNVHNSIDKTVHARKRRVISHAFSDHAIKAMERYILANIRTACNVLAEPIERKKEQQWTPPLDAADWCDWLTFDIMGDLAFGKSFGMLESPQNRFAIEMVGNAAHRHLICGCFLLLHRLHLDRLLFPKIASSRAQYMQYSRQQASERTKLGLDIDRKDFFYYLLNAQDPETGAGFTPTELWGESNLLIIAGSDTTSTAMAATIFYLTHSKRAMDRLVEEVRGAFGNVEEIVSGPVLNGCIYLRACIDEAMRLAPPVGGMLPREVLQAGLTVDGRELPTGTVVGVPHYAIHHNPDYFPEPFSFLPERWVAGSAPSVTAKSVELAQSAFCPFSVGPRGCIGKGLAYVELMVSIARLVWLFDVRVAPGTHMGEEYQLKDTFTSAKNGPMIQVRLKAM